MVRVVFGLGLMALTGLLLAGGPSPAVAQGAQTRDRATSRYAAEPRPRITVHPRGHRPLSPNATRHCTAWLAKEYRESGTVITPQMRCWWED